ncbi:MAG: oligosaccharide flippase family protein [Bacteroidota bacterium]
MTKIKNIKTVQNFFYLGLSQGINLLVPVVIVPYLIKTVGIEKFGVIALVQTISSFFYIFTDYGFNITAVKALSINRYDDLKVSEITNQVLSTKLFLTIISLPIFIGVSWYFLKENASLNFILMSFMLVLGQAFFPIWLFQGLERNQYFAFINIIAKLSFLLLLLLFVQKEQDFIWCNFILGITNFMSGIAGTIYFMNKQKKQAVNFFIPFSLIKQQLKEGKEIFISNFSVNIYISSNVLILALFASPYLVGIYSIVEKIIFLIRALLGIYIQAIYSNACKIAKEINYQAFKEFISKYNVALLLIVAVAILILNIFSTEIVSLFSKKDINELVHYVRILSIVPFIVALNVSSNITLLAYNYKLYSARISIVGSFLSILLSFVLVPIFLINGTVLSIVITEIFITISLRLVVNYLSKTNSFSEIVIL